MICSTDGVVERDLGRADDAPAGRVQRRPDLDHAARRPSGRRRRRGRSRLDRLAELGARAAAPDAVGLRRREGEAPVACVDVQSAHVARQPDRSGEPRRAAGVTTIVVAADERGREHGVRVRGDVERGVVERGGAQVARERRRQRDGTEREDRPPTRGETRGAASENARSPDERCPRIRRMPAVSARTRLDFERMTTIGRRGAGRRLPRDVWLHADGEARAQRDARPARRRPAARSTAPRARNGSSCVATSGSSSSRRSS